MEHTDINQQMDAHREEQINELFGDLNGFIVLRRMFGEGHIHVGLSHNIPTKTVRNYTGLSTKEIIKRLDAIEAQQQLLNELFYTGEY